MGSPPETSGLWRATLHWDSPGPGTAASYLWFYGAREISRSDALVVADRIGDGWWGDDGANLSVWVNENLSGHVTLTPWFDYGLPITALSTDWVGELAADPLANSCCVVVEYGVSVPPLLGLPGRRRPLGRMRIPGVYEAAVHKQLSSLLTESIQRDMTLDFLGAVERLAHFDDPQGEPWVWVVPSKQTGPEGEPLWALYPVVDLGVRRELGSQRSRNRTLTNPG